MTIHVMDVNFSLIGEIVHYSSLRLNRLWAGVGSFTLQLPVREALRAGVAVGCVLVPTTHPERSMIVRSITRTDGAQNMEVSGQTLSGYLTQRITLPSASSDLSFGYDRIIADAESVMKHYVAGNVTAPEDAKRRMDFIQLEENQHRGKQAVPWSSRFDALDQTLKEIGLYADAGFDVIPDFTLRKFVFRYIAGRDLTGTEAAAVTFAVDMGSASSVAYKDDISKEKTTIYVGGKGEDEHRDILAVGTDAAGVGRHELFADAGSCEGADELRYEGERKLCDHVRLSTLSAQVVNTPAMQYGSDWDVGDLVNVLGAGVQMRSRITQVQEAYEAGRAIALTVTFGEPDGGITGMIGRIKNAKVR